MRQKRLALWRTNRRKAADFSDLSAERQASSALRYVQALMKTNAAAAEGRWRSNPNLPSLAAIHHSMNSTDSHTSYGSHSFNPSSTAHRVKAKAIPPSEKRKKKKKICVCVSFLCRDRFRFQDGFCNVFCLICARPAEERRSGCRVGICRCRR